MTNEIPKEVSDAIRTITTWASADTETRSALVTVFVDSDKSLESATGMIGSVKTVARNMVVTGVEHEKVLLDILRLGGSFIEHPELLALFLLGRKNGSSTPPFRIRRRSEERERLAA